LTCKCEVLTHQTEDTILSNHRMNYSLIHESPTEHRRRILSNSVENKILNDLYKEDKSWYLKEPFIEGKAPQLVIFIQTRDDAASQRDFIRSTWANKSYYYDGIGRHPFVFFVCGLDPCCHRMNDNLTTEILANKDILLVNIHDTYDNLTLKGVLAMHWILKTMGDSVKYVIKTDDDVMLNIFRWMSVLKSLSLRNKSKFILGFVWQKSKVKRNGKYIVNEEEYPEQYYPSFCAGPGYAISRDAIVTLLNMTSHVRYLKREDVFITGLLAAAGRVSRYSFSKNSYILYSYQYQKNNNLESTMLVHGGDKLLQRYIWNLYVDKKKLNAHVVTKYFFVTSLMWPEEVNPRSRQ